MSSDITVQNFQTLLPKGTRFNVDQTFVDDLNNMIQDEEVREHFRDNLITYTTVLKDGRYRLDQYVKAIRYVSYKMLGSTNVVAYQRAFTDKFQDWLTQGKQQNEIASYVSAYHKSKLVMAIFEQAIIPVHVLNAGHFQQAINIQVEIMGDEDVSPKVRSDAANSLLTHLKAPETKKIELDIGVGSVSAIDELRQATKQFVEQQSAALINGSTNAKQLAHSSIIPHEVVVNP